MSNLTKFAGGYYAFRTGKPQAYHWVLRDGDHKTVAYVKGLRDARAKAAELQLPLRERLCAPVTIGEAGQLIGVAP